LHADTEDAGVDKVEKSLMRRSTIQDVAKLAGVGKVTVSYVLNGRSETARISMETAERVRQAAESLQYRPNGLARMLASQQTQTFAVVFQYAQLFASGSGFINEVMRGVCAASVEVGFDLMLHTKRVGNPQIEADVLSDGRVDGVLILRDQGDPTLQALLNRNFPTVQFFTRSDDPEAAWVDADNFSGGRMAVRHLLDLGHRRIGMVMGPEGSVPARDRFHGYRDAMEAAGLPIYDLHLCRAGNAAEASSEVLPMLKLRHRPTALFAWSDDVAISCMETARNVGLKLPDDLSILGFDSLDICNRAIPPLTSVRQPVYEMAADATHLLASLLRKDPPSRRQILHPLRLDVRGSTAPLSLSKLVHKEVQP